MHNALFPCSKCLLFAFSYYKSWRSCRRLWPLKGLAQSKDSISSAALYRPEAESNTEKPQLTQKAKQSARVESCHTRPVRALASLWQARGSLDIGGSKQAELGVPECHKLPVDLCSAPPHLSNELGVEFFCELMLNLGMQYVYSITELWLPP